MAGVGVIQEDSQLTYALLAELVFLDCLNIRWGYSAATASFAILGVNAHSKARWIEVDMPNAGARANVASTGTSVIQFDDAASVVTWIFMGMSVTEAAHDITFPCLLLIVHLDYQNDG